MCTCVRVCLSSYRGARVLIQRPSIPAASLSASFSLARLIPPARRTPHRRTLKDFVMKAPNLLFTPSSQKNTGAAERAENPSHHSLAFVPLFAYSPTEAARLNGSR